MRITGKALGAVLLLLAPALASAQGVEWVAKGTRATLVTGGAMGADAVPLYVCRADLGSGVLAVGKFWTIGGNAWECRVGVGGREQSATAFEMLVESPNTEAAYRWVPGHATSYPQRSLGGGRAADGQRWLVCAAWNRTDGSLHPGYIADANCIYAADGAAVVSDTYLVLTTNDPAAPTTEEAQPALEGFDPGGILGAAGVASFCALKENACVATLPAGY